jgi:hypothetical protein
MGRDYGVKGRLVISTLLQVYFGVDQTFPQRTIYQHLVSNQVDGEEGRTGSSAHSRIEANIHPELKYALTNLPRPSTPPVKPC